MPTSSTPPASSTPSNQMDDESIRQLNTLVANIPATEHSASCPIKIFEYTEREGKGFITDVAETDPRNTKLKNLLDVELDASGNIICEASGKIKPIPTFTGTVGLPDVDVSKNPYFTTELRDTYIENEKKRFYVGYDTEFQVIKDATEAETDANLISHQWYIAHNGSRKSFILLSDKRLREKQFCEIVANAARTFDSNTKIDEPIEIYCAAHFSIVDGGWLIQDLEDKTFYSTVEALNTQPEKHLPILAASAFLKLLINHVFTDKNNQIRLSEFEQHIIPNTDTPAGSEFFTNLLADSRLAALKEAITNSSDAKKKSSASQEYSNICANKLEYFKLKTTSVDEKHSTKALKAFKPLFDYLKNKNRFPLPVIQKRDRIWIKSTTVFIKPDRDALVNETKSKLESSLKKFFSKYLEECINDLTPTVQSNSTSHQLSLKEWYLQKIVFEWICSAHNIQTASDEQSRLALTPEKPKKKPTTSSDTPAQPSLLNRKCKINFVDTIGYGLGSLKKVGETIGIGKIDLEGNTISNMQEYLRTNPINFYRYAMRDSVVTAEAVAWFNQKFLVELGVPLKTRTAAYTAEFFKKQLIERVYTRERVENSDFSWIDTTQSHFKEDIENDDDAAGINLKYFLGWEKPPKMPADVSEDRYSEFDFQRFGRKRTATWTPTLQMQHFARFYAGGWNSVFMPGVYEKYAYWDLKSAYPSALAMLEYDYLFSEPLEYAGAAAKQKVAKLLALNTPFLIAGVELSFAFNATHEIDVLNKKTNQAEKIRVATEPMFPVRIEEPENSPILTPESEDFTIHIKSGHAYVMWPEFYTAHKLGLLDNCIIHGLETFETIKDSADSKTPADSELAKIVIEMLRKRGEPGKKAIYKAVLNYAYGKFCEAIKKKKKQTKNGIVVEKRHPGAISCYPIAAYCTSICRAVMGELLNMGNPCFGITTDGFITPTTNYDELRFGEIATKTQQMFDAQQLKTIKTDDSGNPADEPYKYVELAYSGNLSFFGKTRMYILINLDANGKAKQIKISKGGVQTSDQDASADADRKNMSATSLEDTDDISDELETEGVPDANDATDSDDDDDLQNNIIHTKSLITALRDKKYKKRSWPSFGYLKALDENGKCLDRKPIKRLFDSSVSLSYDSKRKPLSPFAVSEFNFEEANFDCPKFTTRPLLSKNEFVTLRKTMRRNMTTDEYTELMPPEPILNLE